MCAPGKRDRQSSSPTPNQQDSRLPIELLGRVADFLFAPYPRPDKFNIFNVEHTSICCVKPTWKDVEGFMEASPILHQMGMARWFQVLNIRNINDWGIAIRKSSLVREIRCLPGVLTDYSDKQILAKFPRLYALSIDAHNDVTSDGNQWAYRSAFFVLPSSIVRLEVVHAHSPDAKVISAVKRYCPALEQLRLGRCTMFNRPTACEFWKSFPLEHNSYFSSGGVEEYASSLAQELAPLRHLRVLQMGIYLAPSSAVLGHRLYHTRGLSAPNDIDWQHAIPLAQQPLDILGDEDPIQVEPATTDALINLLHQSNSEFDHNCNLCLDQYEQPNRDAEATANRILKDLIPSLEVIQWMNWFTHNHLGVSSCKYEH